MIDTNKESISLIAGPAELKQPLFSYDLDEICEYHPKDIVQAICRHPEISETGSVDKPESWKAIFVHEEITFDIQLSVYEDRPDVFCGFEFSGSCRIIDLVRLRQYLYHNGFESLWFHDQNCEIMDPVGFTRKYAKPS
jgi:hypothetical protein